MTEELEKFEKTIRKKHSFAWTPKYQQEIATDISESAFLPIVNKAIEKLGWDLVYQDDQEVEAKRQGEFNQWTEKITITYHADHIKVKSISLGNEMWDIGRNSKRVKLFIHAFELTKNELSQEELAELEKEHERKSNWDDYEIPESLPQPKRYRTPQIWILTAGGFLISVLLGYILATLSMEGMYIIGLFELGSALLMSFGFKYLIRLSNCTDFKIIHRTLIGTIILTFIFNQLFIYLWMKQQSFGLPFSFIDFIRLRFEHGLTIKSLNTGWIGLLIAWIFQLGFTWLIAYLRVAASLSKYVYSKIPPEVTDFAYYHFVKEKTEDEVRDELSKMGWTKRENQDEVFEAIGAIHDSQAMNRME